MTSSGRLNVAVAKFTPLAIVAAAKPVARGADEKISEKLRATRLLLNGGQSMTISKPQESTRFHRTREAHASETAQDYVEAIADSQEKAGGCRGSDLAKFFGVSHVTVSKILARLQSEGLIDTEPYGPVRLTQNGQALAKRSRERHETVLQFLLTLGVSRSTAEIDSEGIEHHVSDETLRAFRRFLKKYK